MFDIDLLKLKNLSNFMFETNLGSIRNVYVLLLKGLIKSKTKRNRRTKISLGIVFSFLKICLAFS